MKLTRAFFFVISLIFTLSVSAQEQAEPKREWTILVYENGKNSLDAAIRTDIDQQEKVGSTDKINIVVEWGSKGKDVVRMKMMKKVAESPNVTSPVLKNLGPNHDMGDWKNILDFFKWGVANFPAEHYMVVIADHGSGWHGSRNTKVVSFDDLTGHAVDVLEFSKLAREMQAIAPVDILGFDACLMSMTEVATEFSGFGIKYLLASQEVEPGPGWAYDDLLNAANKVPNLSPEAFGKIVVDTYIASYQGGSQGTDQATLSLTSLPQSEAVIKEVKFLSDLVLAKMNPQQKTELLALIAKSRHFSNTDYKDLIHLLNLIDGSANLTKVIPKDWLIQAKQEVSQMVIVNGATNLYTEAHGVSIWGALNQADLNIYLPLYNQTRFGQETGWGEAQASMIQHSLLQYLAYPSMQMRREMGLKMLGMDNCNFNLQAFEQK